MTRPVAAVIQARMGATRLPGKVLKILGGATVLAQVIRRVRACQQIDQVVVATSDLTADDVVASYAATMGCGVFRGSENDVLSRYYGAALEFRLPTIVRITADCPLLDPDLLSSMIRRFEELNSSIDYLSNTLVRTHPRGLDAEIFSFQALQRCFEEASRPHEREHVTPYLYENPALFRLYAYTSSEDLSGHRWTLDTEEDYRFLREIYNALERHGSIFATHEVLDLLRSRPDLMAINASVAQKKLDR